jgi:hypothetical protein
MSTTWKSSLAPCLRTSRKNELVVALDRLHTLTTGFLRKLCEKRGLTTEQGKPLHSLFGQYVRALYEAGHLESKMTGEHTKSVERATRRIQRRA